MRLRSVAFVSALALGACQNAEPTSTPVEYTSECGADFAALVDRNINEKIEAGYTELTDQSQIIDLNAAETLALTEYFKMFELDTPFADFQAYMVNRAKYLNLATGHIAGYRIDVDVLGGDESKVRFYIRIRDARSLDLLTTYWHNQSPVRSWPCQNYETQADSDAELLRTMISSFGEYFQFERTPFADSVIPYDMRNASDRVNRAVRAEIRDINHDNRHNPDWIGADVSEAFRLVDGERTIGYAIRIEYNIDHGLFDGGGITLYLDKDGDKVAHVEWWG